MKRTLTLVALMAAAAIPATSNADSAAKATASKGGNDLKVRFDLISLGNKPKRIEDFKFKNFTVSCAVGGPVDASGTLGRMNVNDAGKFDGNARNGDAKVHVEGEVKQNGNKVVGILKSSGDFGGGAENCKTKVGWEAS